jgi:hypothetical protein
MKKDKTIIGSEEVISFPEVGIDSISARIDTGAATSSLGVKKIQEKDGVLCCTMPNQQKVCFKDYKKKVIKSSFGHIEERYVIRLLVNVLGRKIRTDFTLANRSKMTFPVLIGRKLLKNKFVVDITLKNQSIR